MLQRLREIARCAFRQTVRHAPAIIFLIAPALDGTTFYNGCNGARFNSPTGM
ncbi:MAG: hypothetical protein PCALPYG88_1930 [uncultured Paraburkholderia sp.]|nr:MAG: hypothetical protein PCALPYG88_1930 [uncultured Paraburkholderia sp.]